MMRGHLDSLQGLRMSCPSILRRGCVTRPPVAAEETHRLCWRLINRFVKANDVVQSGRFGPAFIQPESKCNSAQRTVFRGQLVDITTVPRTQHCMALRSRFGRLIRLEVRPFDLPICACLACGAERSLAIASRICCAWSRKSTDDKPSATGSNVAARNSHYARIISILSEINCDGRLVFLRVWPRRRSNASASHAMKTRPVNVAIQI